MSLLVWTFKSRVKGYSNVFTKSRSLAVKGIEHGDSDDTVRVLEGPVEMGLQAGREVTHALCPPGSRGGTRHEWCLRLRCSSWAPHR